MFSPAETITLARALEPYRLFFYEDPVRPFNAQSLRMVRAKTNVPLATGEQLAHKWEFQPLIEEELVDYLRIDIVHAGGVTEAKKIMAAAEIHGQRSAFHYGASPINNTACLHVDCAIPNFGIQEWGEFPTMYEIFPNAPRAVNGYVEPTRGPGLGLEFDEAEARKRPSRDAELPHRYWPDGAVADY
jgi:mannonate dehydratase